MTQVSRRQFLALGAGLSAAALLRIPAPGAYSADLPAWDVRKTPFNAIGDGVHDDTAALQKAIDGAAARGGGTVVVPPGRYLISQPLRIDANHVRLAGTPGESVFTRRSATRYIDIGGPHRFRSQAAMAVRAKAAAGDRVIAVQAATRLLPGSWAAVVSGTGSSANKRKTRRHAQFVQISSATNDRIDVATPLRMDCDPQNDDRIVSIDWLEGCQISGLAFDGASAQLSGQRLIDSNMLTFEWCLAPMMRNLSAWDLPNLFISLEGCLRTDIADVSARDSRSTGFGDSERGYGYIVVERGLNEAAQITRLNTERVRHSYTTTDAPSGIGEPYGTRVTHSVANNSRGAGFDTHSAGENISFTNCRVIGSEHAGFQIRSTSSELIDCAAEQCQGPGLLNHITAVGTKVRGFSSSRTGTGRFRKLDWSKHGAILDRGTGSRIDGAEVRDCAGPGVDLERGNDPVYRNIRVHNPCLSDTPVIGFRVKSQTVIRLLIESCLVSSDTRRIDIGYLIEAPNLEEGLIRACRAENARKLVASSSLRLRIEQ